MHLAGTLVPMGFALTWGFPPLKALASSQRPSTGHLFYKWLMGGSFLLVPTLPP